MSRAFLEQLLEVAKRAADPAEATTAHWPSEIGGPISVLAIGKASTKMLAAARRAAEGAGGVWAAREDVFVAFPEQLKTPEVLGLAAHAFAVDHPLPTVRNCAAADACEAWLASRPADHTLIVLLSGGASAHLCAPTAGVTLEDVIAVTNGLQRAGASIRELNTVRKHIDRLKGGRMAHVCAAKAIRVLTMSDVIGDDPSVIASGPFSVDATTQRQALDILAKHNLNLVAPNARRILLSAALRSEADTPKEPEQLGRPVRFDVIASVSTVLRAMGAWIQAAGVDLPSFNPEVPDCCEGRATEVARGVIDALGRYAKRSLQEATPLSPARPFVWLVGGEWTVDVGNGRGKGGPSQEFALYALSYWDWIGAGFCTRAIAADSAQQDNGRAGPPDWHPGYGDLAILAYSTDGIDGPTDSAGVIADYRSSEWLLRTVDVDEVLDQHDSYTALELIGAHIKTGPTGTNLNHVVAMLWTPARLRLEGGDKAEDGI